MLASDLTGVADARAYWFDRTHLRWPGKPQGRYRLLHSAEGTIRIAAGTPARGFEDAIVLARDPEPLPDALAARFGFVAPGASLRLGRGDAARVADWLRGQVLLVQEDARGNVRDATYLQTPGVLNDLYAPADALDDLGVRASAMRTALRLWAPTARAVSACVYPEGDTAATSTHALARDDATGAWAWQAARDLSGQYYAYLVDVFMPGTGLVRNRVTDPYSVSLAADSTRSYIADPGAPALQPPGWRDATRPDALAAPTDMVVYELHVRDFSRDDATVPSAHRGKYLAFTDTTSDGMRHLRALRQAGITDIHLLPVFDLASVPERGCATPAIPAAAPDAEAQQAAVERDAARDCFNWGYDPWHFNAPEGSYASDAGDGTVRVREFRAMVQALHAAGLRVGMDVVYNHTTASGQDPRSVLDRIVPGYYHRLDAKGAVERSTCCANTATEHRMMGKLMRDSVVHWIRHYRIDSFRFDLMGHQPRAEMERLQREADAAAGRHVDLIGEGWNFGEVADGQRFVQAAQSVLAGSGISTFSDRARDAIRGGGPSDHGVALVDAKGYVNGLAESGDRDALLHAADLVRAGLAGTLRDVRITDASGRDVPLSQVDYKGQPAGYAAEPSEVVNYVENHDNQTLFDINAWKLPCDATHEDRARAQLLALALNAFSQGIAYFHAGGELMRSKSMDRNSFDSGDWFNRIDWTARGNHFATGLPPRADNGQDWDALRPLLRDARIAPRPQDIAFVRDAFLDLLRIRAGSTLLRMRTARDIRARLTFPNTGPAQEPAVVAAHIDGRGYPGGRFAEMLLLANVAARPRTLALPSQRGKRYVLHPVQAAPDAADPRPRDAAYDAATGRFTLPARTAVVFVVE